MTDISLENFFHSTIFQTFCSEILFMKLHATYLAFKIEACRLQKKGFILKNACYFFLHTNTIRGLSPKFLRQKN